MITTRCDGNKHGLVRMLANLRWSFKPREGRACVTCADCELSKRLPYMDANQPEQNVHPPVESSAQAREAYAKSKQDLIDALARKRAIDKQLISCEVQIYNFEATYLADTAGNGGGNIIQGFDSYLKNPSVNKRRTEVSDADRMFSNSSSTYAKVSVSTVAQWTSSLSS